MIDKKLSVAIYFFCTAMLVLGMANLFRLNELNTRIKRIEASQSNIQRTVANKNNSVNFDFSKGYSIGDSNAAVNIAIFLDYECGYCKLFLQDVYPLLYDEYISTGLVHFVVMDFPLSRHEIAYPLSQFASCAQQNGIYDLFREKLLAYPEVMDNTALEHIGTEIGLNPTVCLEDSIIYRGIKMDIETGKALGVKGTPTFIYNNKLVTGFKKYAEMRSIINDLLDSQEAACN